MRGGKKGDKSKTRPGDKDYTTKRGDKDFHRKGHDVKRKRRPYKPRTDSSTRAEGAASAGTGGARMGASKRTGGVPAAHATNSSRVSRAKKSTKLGNSKSKASRKKEEITIDGKKIRFQKGGLHRSLKVPMSHKFTKSQLNPLKKIPTGDSFRFSGKSIKMTPKIKKQITFGLTLMGFKKR